MRVWIMLAAVLVISTGVAAQPSPPPRSEAMPGFKSEAHALVGDIESLWSKDALLWSTVGTVGGLAVYPLDKSAQTKLEKTETGALRDIFYPGKLIGAFYPGKLIGAGYTQVGLAAATYAVGRFTDRPRVARVGMDLVRAQGLTWSLVQGLKFATRRERPDGSDARSLPSGHSALMSTTATVLQRRFGWVRAWPAYAVASYVATSRVTSDRHHLSDAVAGGMLGVVVGRRVTRDKDRLAHLVPVFGPGSMAIVWQRSVE
jgi:membrane-associated phospholipid phosphatase